MWSEATTLSFIALTALFPSITTGMSLSFPFETVTCSQVSNFLCVFSVSLCVDVCMVVYTFVSSIQYVCMDLALLRCRKMDVKWQYFIHNRVFQHCTYTSTAIQDCLELIHVITFSVSGRCLGIPVHPLLLDPVRVIHTFLCVNFLMY